MAESTSLLYGGSGDAFMVNPRSRAESVAVNSPRSASTDGSGSGSAAPSGGKGGGKLVSCAPLDLLDRADRVCALMPRVTYQRDECKKVVDTILSCKMYLPALDKYLDKYPDGATDFVGTLAKLLDGLILAERRVNKGVSCSAVRAALRDSTPDRRKFGECRDMIDLAYRQIGLKLNVRLLSTLPPRAPRIAIATHTYRGTASNDLNFRYGDRIELIPSFDKINWWKGKTGVAGHTGYFPINYCIIAHPILDDIEICKVQIKVWRTKPVTDRSGQADSSAAGSTDAVDSAEAVAVDTGSAETGSLPLVSTPSMSAAAAATPSTPVPSGLGGQNTTGEAARQLEFADFPESVGEANETAIDHEEGKVTIADNNSNNNSDDNNNTASQGQAADAVGVPIESMENLEIEGTQDPAKVQSQGSLPFEFETNFGNENTPVAPVSPSTVAAPAVATGSGNSGTQSPSLAVINKPLPPTPPPKKTTSSNNTDSNNTNSLPVLAPPPDDPATNPEAAGHATKATNPSSEAPAAVDVTTATQLIDDPFNVSPSTGANTATVVPISPVVVHSIQPADPVLPSFDPFASDSQLQSFTTTHTMNPVTANAIDTNTADVNGLRVDVTTTTTAPATPPHPDGGIASSSPQIQVSPTNPFGNLDWTTTSADNNNQGENNE